MKKRITSSIIFCLFISCSSSTNKNNETNIIIYKLAYISQIALISPNGISQEMKTFIFSEEYLKIRNSDVKNYLKTAFTSIREAVNQTGTNQGMLVAQAQHNLVLAGEQLKLSECDAFSKAVGINKTIEAIKAASKLAELGKDYWE